MQFWRVLWLTVAIPDLMDYFTERVIFPWKKEKAASGEVIGSFEYLPIPIFDALIIIKAKNDNGPYKLVREVTSTNVNYVLHDSTDDTIYGYISFYVPTKMVEVFGNTTVGTIIDDVQIWA